MNAKDSVRIDWVDAAKGICIMLVVMMHSTLGLGEAVGQEGFMHEVVAFAKPFRMPDFFLVSGLFLARTIDRDWRTYLDRKVLHFAYFYVLWVVIQSAFKIGAVAPGGDPVLIARHFGLALIEPFGTLWFIYLLPVFFVTTKLLRRVPWPILLGVAAVLESLPIHTGWTVIDEFAARYVYFLAGYLFASQIFTLADSVREHAGLALAGLAAWALFNGAVVTLGWSELPVVSLVLGFAGALAIVTLAVLFTKLPNIFGPVLYAGKNSIVVYLAFFLPMAITRTVLIKLGFAQSHTGWACLAVMSVAIVTPLIFHWLVKSTPLRFLFERPSAFRIGTRPSPKLMPAE